MTQITLNYTESKATKYIPHTPDLFNKYQEVLAKFPEIEDHCDFSYLEPGDDEKTPGIKVWWANKVTEGDDESQVYFASPIDLSTDETASLEELECLHELIGDFWFLVVGSSSHGDDFESKVTAIKGKVSWSGDWK